MRTSRPAGTGLEIRSMTSLPFLNDAIESFNVVVSKGYVRRSCYAVPAHTVALRCKNRSSLFAARSASARAIWLNKKPLITEVLVFIREAAA